MAYFVGSLFGLCEQPSFEVLAYLQSFISSGNKPALNILACFLIYIVQTAVPSDGLMDFPSVVVSENTLRLTFLRGCWLLEVITPFSGI